MPVRYYDRHGGVRQISSQEYVEFQWLTAERNGDRLPQDFMERLEAHQHIIDAMEHALWTLIPRHDIEFPGSVSEVYSHSFAGAGASEDQKLRLKPIFPDMWTPRLLGARIDKIESCAMWGDGIEVQLPERPNFHICLDLSVQTKLRAAFRADRSPIFDTFKLQVERTHASPYYDVLVVHHPSDSCRLLQRFDARIWEASQYSNGGNDGDSR